MTHPIAIFYVYAEADEGLRQQLDTHLALLRRQELIAEWQPIQAGAPWAEKMEQAFDEASLILLLVSADFLNSDVCYTQQMQRALQRQSKGEVHVIPILLRPVELTNVPFTALQMLPIDGKPVTLWSNQDAAWTHIISCIRRLLEGTPLPNMRRSAPPPALSEHLMNTYSPRNDFSANQERAHATIDTDEIIRLFHQFLNANSMMRVLYLVGEAKLGKTHLLTKVFPTLVSQKYQFRHIIIDLHYPMHTIPDILSLTSSQFDRKHQTYYQNAYREWAKQPKVGMEHVLLFLSSLTLSATQGKDTFYKSEHYLTTQFIKDLETYNDRPLLLLIDHVDTATEKVQMWLINSLLVQLVHLKHVWVVMAGRSLPAPHGSYLASCLHYQLSPVTETEAYITYCRLLNVMLVEQSVRDIAQLFDYRPGLFVDYVLPKFGS